MSGLGVVLGTAGHVDHGKTSLVRALTGVDTDRWREEKQRGLTIDLGFARLPGPEGLEVGVVDVPGHEDFLRNMLAGATGLDLLLLVVAADEGPMPQTREHLAIASLLGIRRGVVALTKRDRVDDEWLELAREATLEELQRTIGTREWPIIPVSSVTGEGVEALRAHLLALAGSASERHPDDLFRLPVDRAFSVHGTGTVVTGTVWSGSVGVGDEVRVLPGGTSARVRSLQVHGETRNAVEAGRRCALALVGVDPDETPRGTVVVKGAGWRTVDRLAARVRILDRPRRPLEHLQRVRVYHGTRETMARVRLPGRVSIGPGETGWAVLRLERPLVARARDRLVIRFYSPVTTIGGGQVAELAPPGRGSDRFPRWGAILDEGPEAAFVAAVTLADGTGLEDSELPHATGLALPALRRLSASPPPDTLELSGRWFHVAELEEAERFLEERLASLHESRPRARAASLGELRGTAVRRYAAALVDRALARLAARGSIRLEGPHVRLPDHLPVLSASEAAARQRLLTALEEGGLEPPTLDELERIVGGNRELLHDLLRLLEDEVEIIPISAELYLTREMAARLTDRARVVLRGTPIASPSAFKEALGVSRKYLIPMLEYLDRTGVTRRTGEGRELVG